MEALSPSTAIRDWSASTLSPTATMISVTSTSSPPISGTLTSLAAAATGAAATGAAAWAGAAATAGAAPATSNTITREPVETLAPAATLISTTRPANGAGTSMEALSPSTAMMDWSASTMSPTATMISVTSTSSSPMSGTCTSLRAAAAGAAAGAAATGAAAWAGAGAAAPSASKIMIWEPVATLSPTLIRISLTIPADGAGTSMEALSPSTAMMDWSSSTLSPTATMISVTSTSSAPISGTIICLDIVLYPLACIRVTDCCHASFALTFARPCRAASPGTTLDPLTRTAG